MRTFLVAVIMGLSGAVAVSVSIALQWPSWVMFIAWVGFYVFGKNIQTSVKTFLNLILGIFMGVLIQVSAAYLSPIIGRFAFPLSVFLCIGSLAYFAQIRAVDNIPAWFLGLIILFGTKTPIEPVPIIKLFIPVIAGFLFASINHSAIVQLLNWLQTMKGEEHSTANN